MQIFDFTCNWYHQHSQQHVYVILGEKMPQKKRQTEGQKDIRSFFNKNVSKSFQSFMISFA